LKRIFLTGPIGCGKSTLIRTVLGNSLSVAGGFVTERILKGEELVGFEIVSAGVSESLRESVNMRNSVSQKLVQLNSADLGLYEKAGHTRLRFLTFKEGKVKRNDEAFSVFASALLREAGTKPFAVIDEIGGFEILIPEFMEAFELLLESQVPCIGVLKSLPSANKLSETAGLDSEYLRAAESLYLRLVSDPETEIVELSSREDKHALHKLRNWKDQYLRDREPK
jgi:nucleoside-triphosphatase